MIRMYSRKTSNQAAKRDNHANDSTTKQHLYLEACDQQKLRKCNPMQLLVEPTELLKVWGEQMKVWDYDSFSSFKQN